MTIDDAAELSLLLGGADFEGHTARVALTVGRAAFEGLDAFDLGPVLTLPFGAAAMASTE